jgi:hypothetical protein
MSLKPAARPAVLLGLSFFMDAASFEGPHVGLPLGGVEHR